MHSISCHQLIAKLQATHTHTNQEAERMSRKRKGLEAVVESLTKDKDDLVFNGRITENEDGNYVVLEDPIPSSSPVQSRNVSAGMEAKSPMQNEVKEDPIPSSSRNISAGMEAKSPMHNEVDDDSVPSSQASGFGDVEKAKKKRDTTVPWRPHQQSVDEEEFNASTIAATLK